MNDLMVRSVAQRRVSNHGGTFRTRCHPSRRRFAPPQDEVERVAALKKMAGQSPAITLLKW
jgi:hypothetical protein